MYTSTAPEQLWSGFHPTRRCTLHRQPVFSDQNEQAFPADAKDTPSPSVWLYSGTIFLSAFLLFQVQPILAKLILPWFGGAAAVWIISLAFYQLTYLLGNVYAHMLIQRSGPRFSTRCHALLLLATLLLLPIVPSAFWQPRGGEEPMWRIWGVLAATVGLPFLLLSATSPLLQAWHTLGRGGARPYRFYALSNAGSLLALLSYPVVVEPLVSTHHQALIWSVGFAGFVALCWTLAFRPPVQKLPRMTQLPEERPGWKLQLLWLSLAASASALLLAITHHVSQNIAAIPLLWVVPLSLYLLSLILCFEGDRWYRRWLFLSSLPVALAGMAYLLSTEFESAGPELQIPLYFAGLFICCMVCHGEMASLKPRPEFLTLFYLMVSGGGALGGLFVALLAPHAFRGFYELPIALGACAIVVLIVLLRKPQRSAQRLGRPAILVAEGLTVLLLALLFHIARLQSRGALVMVRNFYGVLRVNIVPPGTVRPAVTQLRNGTVVHGEEILDVARNDVPTSYYGQQSGVGITLLFARQRGNIRVGVIGLGVGTLARYGQRGDHYFFYEINPLVVDLAANLFDFLGQSEAQVDIIPGDARLSLERQPPQEFDVLVVDAFSGDAIPVHLLTREAFELYFRHLKPQGVLAIHVSNRLLDLPRLVEAVARSVGARAVKVTNSEDEANAVYESTWMLLDRTATPNRTVSGLAESGISLPPGTSSQIEDKDRVVRAWTDDYSNLLEILK
jgi:SAM-dependent methyltransferase